MKITESGDEVKDAFSELIEFADEYDISADELISTLTRLGYVQSSVASSAEETASAFSGWDALNAFRFDITLLISASSTPRSLASAIADARASAILYRH